MKPVVVLGLVGAAVAALFFVLFRPTGPPEGSGQGGLMPGAQRESSEEPGRTTNIVLENTGGAAEAAENRTGIAREAVVGDPGEEFSGAWNNGLDGQVFGPGEVPLEGARLTVVKNKFSSQFAAVEAALNSQTGHQAEAWSAISDAQGMFSISNLPPGSDYMLSALHPDFSRTEKSGITVTPNVRTPITLIMATGFELRGRIMDDASGAPVPGAELVLQSVFALLPGARSDDEMATTSAEDGTYRFLNVPAGTRNLSVNAEGYGSRTRNNLLFAGLPSEPTFQDFRLAPGQCLRGRIVAPDRTPIAGAQIEATSYETAQVSRGQGVSNADGYFEICDLAEGTFMVIARAKNFSDQRLTRVKLSDPDIQIVMARQGGVMGEVVSRSDGSVVTSFFASVRAVAPGSTSYGRAVAASKFENPDGRFELSGLEAGSYVMQVEAPGFAPTYSDSFIVNQGIVTPDVRVELGQGGSISGRLVDAVTGQPIEGALVATLDNGYVENPFTQMLGALVPRTTTDKKARTDSDGSFRLDLITATTYQLQIDHEGYTRKTIKDLIVVEGQTRDLGSIRLPKGATVRGTVYDAAGSPLAHARISLTGRINFPGMVRSDGEGRFILKNVQAGTWQLSAVRSVSESEGNPFGAIIDMKKSEVTITVADGQEIVRNLTIGS